MMGTTVYQGIGHTKQSGLLDFGGVSEVYLPQRDGSAPTYIAAPSISVALLFPQYCLINTVRTLDARTRSPGIYTERLRRYSEAVSPDGPCIFPSRKVEDGCCAPPQGSLENPRRGPCRELKTDLYPSARRLKKQNKGKNSTRDGGVSGRPRWEHLPALIAGKTNPCQEFCPTQ